MNCSNVKLKINFFSYDYSNICHVSFLLTNFNLHRGNKDNTSQWGSLRCTRPYLKSERNMLRLEGLRTRSNVTPLQPNLTSAWNSSFSSVCRSVICGLCFVLRVCFCLALELSAIYWKKKKRGVILHTYNLPSYTRFLPSASASSEVIWTRWDESNWSNLVAVIGRNRVRVTRGVSPHVSEFTFVACLLRPTFCVHNDSPREKLFYAKVISFFSHLVCDFLLSAFTLFDM